MNNENTVLTKKITIAGNDIKEYRIVYGYNASESEIYAAKELSKYLYKTIGYELQLTDDENQPSQKEIIIGRTNRFDYNSLQETSFGEEGFIIKVSDNHLIIGGGEKRGALYGVYTFLEKYIGWRFLSYDCEVLNPKETIDIPENTSDIQTPLLEWRDAFVPAYYVDADFSCKRKINSSYRRQFSERHGGSFYYPGRFVHTMEELVGVPQHHQPCFSSDEVLEKCIENVKKLLSENPDARLISVTQNDNEFENENYCKCDKCRKIDEEEGSHAGSLLRFVNKVADAIREEYPKVSLITLAYLHTIKCPEITKPRDNVVIEFAPMHLCYSHSIDDDRCKVNREFLQDFLDWSRVSKRIYIWDYDANFSFTVPIFPDFQVLRQNIRYYADHNVAGMFCEGDNHHRPGETTEFSELRAYLISKLLWEPYMTEEEYYTHMEDFLTGYYGKGGKYIKEYLDLIAETIDDPEHHVFCYQNPCMLLNIEKFLSRLERMEYCWNEAQNRAETEEQKDRVNRVRLQYTYLKLLYSFDKVMENSSEEEKQAIIAENEYFYNQLFKYNIHPRDPDSKIPEMTDFTRSAGVGIYW